MRKPTALTPCINPVNPIIMKRIFLTFILHSLVTTALMAQYSIHSCSGDVKIKKGMRLTPVSKGITVSPADILELAEGAQVEIFNASNSQTYRCDKPGQTSVSGIMISATTLSANKGKSIRDNMNFSRPSATGTGHVYVESGMVKRSMATYDPEAKNIEVDPRQLSFSVIKALRDPASMQVLTCPTDFSHATTPEGGLGFTVGNTLESPIYFNVLKVSGDSIAGISISELGQPSGSYVLLPAQTISREQLKPLPEQERHILIMTHFNFDIDKLIEQLEGLASSNESGLPDSTLEVYVSPL